MAREKKPVSETIVSDTLRQAHARIGGISFRRYLQWPPVIYFACLVTSLLAVLPAAQAQETREIMGRRSLAQVLAGSQTGKTLYEMGHFAEAAETLKELIRTYQASGDRVKQAMALSNLALVYQQLGQLPEAERSIQEGLTLLSTVKSQNKDIQKVLAQIWEIQGSLQLDQGLAEQSLATWEKAEAAHRQVGDAPGVTRSRINQAQVLQILGFYRRSRDLLTTLSPELQAQSESLVQAVVLRSLGVSLQLAGDLNQSRQVLQKSLAVARHLRSPQHISAALFSLGNTARAQQRFGSAIAYYQEAATVAPNPLAKLQAQINLLSLLISVKQITTAQTLRTQIQPQLETLPLNQAGVYARINYAQTLMKLVSLSRSQQVRLNPPQNAPQKTIQPDPLQEIAQSLATAVRQSQTLGDRRAESYALGNLGTLYEQKGQWADAQEVTQRALVLAQATSASDIAYRWHWQLGRLFRRQWEESGQISQEFRERAIAAYDAAVKDLQSLRGDLVAVNREVQFSFRESVEPVYRESVELLLQTQANQPSTQILDKARQRIEALQLAELDDFFREACLNAKSVLLDKVVDQDNPTAAIIYPIILQNQLQVIVKIPKQPLRYHTITKPRSEVEQVVGQLRQSLVEPDATATVKSLSQQVHQWLIHPIEADLQKSGVETLVFVLDGPLRSIPMAALYDGKQYLVEKYAVALSLGLQLLAPSPLGEEKLKVLAAGLVQPPPNFQQFPPLPEVRSEFSLITQAGLSSQQLLDNAFTSQALERQVNSAPFNVVHLATHGQFSSQAKDTFILAADGPINVTQLDSLLRSREQQQRQAIELLVLSACQTAAGDNRATLGLAGVAVRAGARSTLASLWHISDRSTAFFIGEFYRELASAKVTKAEALRRAQLTLLKKYPNYSRPGYWAPYVLVGNWL
jgi:CHAT domain-containing protein